MAFAKELADACLLALRRIQAPGAANHPMLYLSGCLILLRRLRERVNETGQKPAAQVAGTTLTTSEYRALAEAAIEGSASALGAAYKHRDEIPLLIENRFRVMVADGMNFRPSARSDMLSPSMFSGSELLASVNETQLRRRLAHNYFCLFPEALPIVSMYMPPARNQLSAAHRFVNHFLMFRKMNSVRVDLVCDEVQELELLRSVGDGKYTAAEVQPASVIAYGTIKSYLQSTQYAVDVGVPRTKLEPKLKFYLPTTTAARALQTSWAEDLGRTEPVLRAEAGGGQFRLQHEALLWLTSIGLVDPLDVGAVLERERASTDVRQALRSEFESYVNDCTNKADFLDKLASPS
jgi:hypothetical protein